MIPTHRKSTPPGALLVTQFMEPLGLSQRELAEALGVDEMKVSRLVNNKVRMTPEMAQRLAVLFKMSEQFWMNAQLVYDLSGSHLPAKERTAITRHRTQIFRRYAQSMRRKTGQSQAA